jgi:signal transduction histidine kinase/CheY-like chemotaxis protein
MKQTLKEKPKVVAIITLILAISLYITAFLISNFYLQSFINSNKQSELYYKAIKNLDEVKFYLSGIEGNERGYILSGNKKYIENIESESDIILSDLQRIDSLLNIDVDVSLFSEVKQIISKKMKYVTDIIYIYKSQGMNSASNQFKTLQGFELMKQVVEKSNALQNNLNQHIAEQYAAAKSFEAKNKFWSILMILVVTIIALVSTLVLFRELDQRKLVNKELEIARDKADKANQYKQEFLANMSHEIRTPMNAIVGFSDLLLKTPLHENQKEYANAINKSGENLLGIVNDVLDYSKIEAGMLAITKENFNLRDTINSVTHTFTEKLMQQGVMLTVEIDKATPAILVGDALRLSQILFNLIGNAAKFTKQGRIKVSIKTETIGHQKVQLYFSVLDSGIGIKPSRLEQIFTRYEQAESNTTKEFGGTGLGLSIVKQLVELQGGEISVFSLPDIGSEFSFHLVFDVPIATLSSSISSSELVKDRRFSYHVLLAEDNLLNQKLALEVLRIKGCKVSVANNGLEVLEALKLNTFDLILMDIQMPEMDGYETSRQIRHELELNIPIIALTSNVMEGEREKCLAAGMDDYLTKPIREKDLDLAFSKLKTDTANQNLLQADDKTGQQHLVDLHYLKEISRGNNQFVIEMIDTFLEYNKRDLETLGGAIGRKDLNEAKHIAHKMRSSVQYMGVKYEVEDLLYKIENYNETLQSEMELKQYFQAFSTSIQMVYQILAKESKDLLKMRV